MICYTLLVGYPPFYDDDQKKLFKKIKDARFHFHEEYWKSISPEAIDMIQKMLCVNQKKRWTAKQLLAHPWIIRDAQLLASRSLNESIRTLKKFNARRRFRAAIEMVIFTKRLSRRISAGKKSEDEVTKSTRTVGRDICDSDPPSYLSEKDQSSDDTGSHEQTILSSLESSVMKVTQVTAVSHSGADGSCECPQPIARSQKRSVRFAATPVAPAPPIDCSPSTSAVETKTIIDATVFNVTVDSASPSDALAVSIDTLKVESVGTRAPGQEEREQAALSSLKLADEQAYAVDAPFEVVL